MRAKLSPLWLTSGYSLVELVLVVVILGILLYIATPRWGSISYVSCLFRLQEKLHRTHYAFFELYSKPYPVTQEQIAPILSLLTQEEDAHCFFRLKGKQIIAHIQGETLPFILSPQDFSYKPKIYCSLSDARCRDFWGKTSKK